MFNNAFNPKSSSSLFPAPAFRRGTSRGTRRFALLAASMVLMAGGAAQAVDNTWKATGNGNYFDVPNWLVSTGVPYGPTETATFSNSGTGPVSTVTINGGVSLKSIIFDSGASSYAFDSSNGFYITLNPSSTIETTGTGAHSQTFNTNIALTSPASFISGYTNADHVLTFAGNVYGRANGTNTLTLNGANTGANTVSGAIINGDAGTTAVTKSGAGNWTLSGANTYTGATQVNAGMLMVTGTHTGGGAYTVSGGSLGGAGGRIATSSITVASGAGINVSGAGLGTTGSQNGMVEAGTLELALTGSLDVSQTGEGAFTFVLSESGISDQVKLTSGTLNIGEGVLNLSSFNFDVSNGAEGTFVLFATSSVNGITGSLGSDLTGIVDGHSFSISLGEDDDGFETLQVTVVPEPATTVAMILGLIVCAAAAIRRRRAASV